MLKKLSRLAQLSRCLAVPVLLFLAVLLGSAAKPSFKGVSTQSDSFHAGDLKLAETRQPRRDDPVVRTNTLVTSNQFGLPVTIDLNQAGDYAFVGTNATATFFRPAGGDIRRVFQIGDPIPGVPGSRSDNMLTPRLNSSAKLT